MASKHNETGQNPSQAPLPSGSTQDSFQAEEALKILNKRLLSDLFDLRKEIQAIKAPAKVKNLQTQLATKRQKIHAMEDQVARLTKEKKLFSSQDSTREMSRMNNDLDLSSGDVSTLKKHVNALRIEIETKEDNMKTLNTENRELHDVVNILTNTLEDQVKLQESKGDQMLHHAKVFEEIESNYVQLQEKYLSLSNDLLEMTERNQHLSMEVKSLTSQMEDERDKSQFEKDRLDNDNSELSIALKTSQGEIQKIKEALDNENKNFLRIAKNQKANEEFRGILTQEDNIVDLHEDKDMQIKQMQQENEEILAIQKGKEEIIDAMQKVFIENEQSKITKDKTIECLNLQLNACHVTLCDNKVTIQELQCQHREMQGLLKELRKMNMGMERRAEKSLEQVNYESQVETTQENTALAGRDTCSNNRMTEVMTGVAQNNKDFDLMRTKLAKLEESFKVEMESMQDTISRKNKLIEEQTDTAVHKCEENDELRDMMREKDKLINLLEKVCSAKKEEIQKQYGEMEILQERVNTYENAMQEKNREEKEKNDFLEQSVTMMTERVAKSLKLRDETSMENAVMIEKLVKKVKEQTVLINELRSMNKELNAVRATDDSQDTDSDMRKEDIDSGTQKEMEAIILTLSNKYESMNNQVKDLKSIHKSHMEAAKDESDARLENIQLHVEERVCQLARQQKRDKLAFLREQAATLRECDEEARVLRDKCLRTESTVADRDALLSRKEIEIINLKEDMDNKESENLANLLKIQQLQLIIDNNVQTS